MGLSVELKQPSHQKKLTKGMGKLPFGMIAISKAIMKNGSQQAIKAPVTIASVLAAFRSLLASSETCFFSLGVWGTFFCLFTFTLFWGLVILTDQPFLPSLVFNGDRFWSV